MNVAIDVSQALVLAADLRAAGVRVPKRAATVLRKAAYAIEGDAKVLAPVDTGALKNSISTTISGSRHGVMTAEIGPSVDYAPFVEWGTSTQPGSPYMRPAADRRIPEFTQGLAALASELL